MNRTFAKRGLQSIVAMFLLVGAMVFTSRQATAQTVKTTSSSAQLSNLVNADAAVTILKYQIENAAHPQLAISQPGTQAYDEWSARAYYWKQMIVKISDGASVTVALSDALRETQLVFRHDQYSSPFINRTFLNSV